MTYGSFPYGSATYGGGITSPAAETITIDKWQGSPPPPRRAGIFSAAVFAVSMAFVPVVSAVETVTVDKWFQESPVPVIKKQDINRGYYDIDSNLLTQPENINLDKWYKELSTPVRLRPTPVNTPHNVLVEFSVPPPETITLDKWHREMSIPVPPRPTPVNTPHNVLVEFSIPTPPIGVMPDKWAQPLSIPRADTRSTRQPQYQPPVSAPILEFPDYEFSEAITFTLTPDGDVDPQYNFSEALTITITAPDTGVVEFTADKPYLVMAAVYIDGEDYSSVLQGTVNVTRQDNAAATFDITLKDITKKPSEFLNKKIEIAFQAADGDGIVADYIPLFKGIIKRVSFSESILGALNISGYDYGGVHGTPGELISANITEVLSGSVYIDGPGTYSTGFAPIWDIAYMGSEEDDIEDGRDYFVNTLTGKIVVPMTSNFNFKPGGLSFSYAVPKPTLKDLMEDIAGRKGWSLAEDGVTIEDYTAIAKQPVMSISDESVIDIIRKFLELSGAKAETNLHPNMRIYSETVNITGSDDHVINETIYYEDSLDISIDTDDLITEQTVRSVAKTFANIEVGGSEQLADKSGTAGRELVFSRYIFFQSDWDQVVNIFTSLSPRVIAEVRVRKANIASVSHSAGGTTDPLFPTNSVNIQDSDWVQTIDGDDILFSLWMSPIIEVVTAMAWIHYPGASWTLTVNGTKIKYGDGDVEETVEVTGSRPVTGISDTLIGDVYEHPWAETAAHCGKCANAILTERGNIYNASCEVPLHLAKTMQIGDKINIERSSTVIFKGVIKTLNYNINTETAESPVGIEAKGVGVGI